MSRMEPDEPDGAGCLISGKRDEPDEPDAGYPASMTSVTSRTELDEPDLYIRFKKNVGFK
jgi:hypothetical protein